MLKSFFAGALILLATTFGLHHAPVATTSTPVEPVTEVLTVVNHVSADPITLVANTRFETDDQLIFRSPQAITIPGKRGAADGTVEVTVVANRAGSQYDIGAARLTLPGLASNPTLYQGVYAYTSGASPQASQVAAAVAGMPNISGMSSAGNTDNNSNTSVNSGNLSSTTNLANAAPSDPPQSPPQSALTASVDATSYVTNDELTAQIQQATNALRSLIYQNESAHNSLPASGGFTNNIALTNDIDQLSGTTLNNVTVNGVSGLTAADIPTDITATNYLPLGGGTLTGALVNTATASSSFAGALGIGTTSPSATLAVQGSFSLTGTATIGGDLNLVTREPFINFMAQNGSWQTAIDQGSPLVKYSDYVLADKCQSTNNTCPAVADQIYDNNNQDGAQSVSSIVSGGSGYAVGDTITLDASCVVNPTLQVTSVDGGGGVTGATIWAYGGYGRCLTDPTGTLNQLSSSGSGLGAQFTVTMSYNEPTLGIGVGTWAAIAQGYLPYALTVGGQAAEPLEGGLNILLSGNTGLPFAITNYGPTIIDKIDNNGSFSALGASSSTDPAITIGYAGNGFYSTGFGNVNFTGIINDTNGYQQAGNTILYATSTYSTTLVGQSAGTSLRTSGTAHYDTFIGVAAGSSATSTGYSTGVGYGALQHISNGSAAGVNPSLTAVGYNALTSNTTGYYNTALGTNALSGNTTGHYNTAVGVSALLSSSVGSNNVAIGVDAGYGVTGSQNTILGDTAGDTASYNQITSGSHNISIGYDVAVPSQTANGQLDIGNFIYGTGLTGTGYTVSPGNVGIGTSTPYSRLTVWGSDSASSTAALAISNNASTTEFQVFDGGNAQLAGTLTQNSDQRLKTNVQSLNNSNTLALIDQLYPVTFNWIDPSEGSTQQVGFIAQQVQTIFPQLVSTTSATALTPGGTLGLNYIGLISPIVSAIQGIAHISGDFKSNLIAWLGNASNGIQDLFAENLHAQNELCVGSTCVTPAQFQAMVTAAGQTGAAPSTSGQGSSGAPGTSATSTPDTPPIITINGNNPAIIYVGDTYADLGATVTGPAQDLNLGINVSVDGSATTTADEISIDTSTSSTQTISYFATDQNGETGYATRSVIVGAATSTP